jgi:nicotinamide-nucleotide amidase
LLSNKHLTIATAESCTGGLIANKITDVPGSSNYFIKGYVTYSNESKIKDLGVKESTIKKYGAVSKETALEMALGVRKKAHTNIAISTTGIAGPTGGTKEKPVGLVWFGLATPEGVFTTKRNFLGERTFIKLQTANTALDLIRKYLLNYKH